MKSDRWRGDLRPEEIRSRGIEKIADDCCGVVQLTLAIERTTAAAAASTTASR